MEKKKYFSGLFKRDAYFTHTLLGGSSPENNEKNALSILREKFL